MGGYIRIYINIHHACLDGTLQSEYRSFGNHKEEQGKSGVALAATSSSPLLSFVWKRVILDEAHGIKNTQTLVSMACCQIIAERRWCVTGTPIQNSIQDVYGYLKFLKHEPWCESKFWNHAITSSSNNNNEQQPQPQPQQQEITDLSCVRRILSPLILRRTKDTMDTNGYVQTYIHTYIHIYIYIYSYP